MTNINFDCSLKRLVILCGMLFVGTSIIAQTRQFELAPPLAPEPGNLAFFEGVANGNVVFCDVDNDGDWDAIIAGRGYNALRATILYMNDGLGNFRAIKNNTFPSFEEGAIAFADIDGDGDKDLIMCGKAFPAFTKLYTNDGFGNFTEVFGTPFPNVQHSAVAFADVDSDGDQDVMITGQDMAYKNYCQLYLNNGNGVFQLDSRSIFSKVHDGAIKFLDVDNDSDMDFIMSGDTAWSSRVSEIYLNDGSGLFQRDTGNVIKGVDNGSIDIGDINGDGFLDVVITGDTSAASSHSQLYVNAGTGQFYKDTLNILQATSKGFGQFLDVDGDNDLDLLISGVQYKAPTLYKNNGSGFFTEVLASDFRIVTESSMTFGDVDGDNDLDILITGKYHTFGLYGNSRLYINDGSGNFKEVTGNHFEGTAEGSFDFADIDNDGNLDVLVTGKTGVYTGKQPCTSSLYKGNGNGGFSRVNNTPFPGIRGSSVRFADVDGDNDQDVVIAGSDLYGNELLKLYKNSGNGTFSFSHDIFSEGLSNAAIDFADYDQDNDLDLFVTGYTHFPGTQWTYVGRLYKNNGNGVFTLVSGMPFTGVRHGSVDFALIDNDNYPDLVVTGQNGNDRTTKLYLNNGGTGFSEITNTPLKGVIYGDVDFADIDMDGDLDIVITGEDAQNSRITTLYSNDGNGVFTELLNVPLFALYQSSVSFGDIDQDGDPDLIISGNTRYQLVTYLYINDGTGMFKRVKDSPFLGASLGQVKLVDVDNDNYPDVLVTGYREEEYVYMAKLYLNKPCLIDTSVSQTGITLTALGGASSYTWLNCDSNMAPIANATLQSFTPTKNGNYAVMLSSNGCYDTSACYTINNVGTEEFGHNWKTQISIYPNPTNSKLNLSVGMDVEVKEICLRTITGQVVTTYVVPENRDFEVDINGPVGIYLLEVCNGLGEKAVFKVVKN